MEENTKTPQVEGDATGGVIPYKNVPALLGYYFAVFGIVPCFFPLAIAAVVCGILGLKKAREVPAVKGQVHAWIGIILGGLFSLIYLGFIALAILLPIFVK